MNIIFFSPVSNFKGGAERCLFDMMANPAVTPILVAPETGALTEEAVNLGYAFNTIDFGNIGTVHRPFSFLVAIKALKSMLFAALILKKISRERCCNVVHSNGLKAHVVNCVSRFLGGPKAVIHIHDIPYTVSEKLVWRIMRILCDEVVVVSAPCWPDKTRPNNVSIIHNGTELFNILEARSMVSLRQKIIFGFCGRIHPAKGLHLLIRWLSFVREAGIDACLSIRGAFSEDAPQYESEIRDLVIKLNLPGYVEYCGYISEPEILYLGIDIIVVPSKTPDPLPRSVMEAMARGLPVFGYPAGGIPEMIDDGVTGFFVSNEVEFLDATRKILSDDKILEDVRSNAIKKIQTEFSMENLFAHLNTVYRKVSI